MTEKIEKQSQTEAGLEVTACRRRTNYTKEGDQAMCRITWCCKAIVEHEGHSHQVDTLMILALQHSVQSSIWAPHLQETTNECWVKC